MTTELSRSPSAPVASTAVLLLFTLLVPLAMAAAEEPEPPPYYAIRDARVVTVSGDTLERATVLVADGLIEAVGADLEIPDDAWIVEGAGLTVYPGLIDALSTLGQTPPEEEQGAGRGGGGFPGGGQQGPEIRGPEDRPRTTPWVSAADLLGTEDGRVKKWREAGFTSTVSSPADGFFAGQATVVNLAGGEPEQMVVETPVAQRINFRSGRSRSYPGSLMGILSYVKQVLSDTQHYAKAQELYEQSPRGRKRPAYDRTLQPILDAMNQELPFLLPGDLGRDIDRALKIAEEYGLSPVIYGAQGAYSRIERLADSKVPVLVNLKWPEEERGADPEADTAFRDLYHRRAAPTTPQRLSDAGVRFAFYSGGASSVADVLEGIRAAVENGLDSDRALRALTLDAAEIFGVADRLGSVETGKIANLVVASAEPWAEDVEIKAVFVDGRLFVEPEKKEPAEKPSVDVTGTWTLTMSSPRGDREATARLEMAENGKVTGEVESQRGSNRIEDGQVSGSTLTFTITQGGGRRTFEASYRAEIEGETLSGSMNAGPMSIELSGERTAGAAEAQVAEAGDEDEGPAVTMEELDEVLAIYQGKVREYDTFAITNATVWTVSGETIPNGTVVVKDGKISAVGVDVRVPRGAEVIDANGGHLIPGIIDTHSHLGIEGGGNEGSLAVTSMVTVADVINPDAIGLYRALAGGVTVANTLHGSANPIGGGNAVIKYRWGAAADGMMFEGAPLGIKFALGENPKRSRSFPGSTQRYPATRMGVMDVIREAFTEAQEYQKDWQQYEAAKRAGKEPMPPRVDFKLKTLVEILDGERLVHSHGYRADEMLQLLRLAEEFGFRIATLQHVLEGYKIADEIAAHGAGAGTFSDWWGYKVEAYDAIPYNAALMTQRGVLVSINSDSSEETRHLNQEAAKAVKWGGMDEVEALKLVTLNAAKQLRVEDRVGSIEVGKDADLVLFDGHPLSMFSVVKKTFIEGDLYFDREADRVRQQRVDEIKARLLGKDGDDEGEEGEPPTTTTPETPDVTTPNRDPNRDPDAVGAASQRDN